MFDLPSEKKTTICSALVDVTRNQRLGGKIYIHFALEYKQTKQKIRNAKS